MCLICGFINIGQFHHINYPWYFFSTEILSISQSNSVLRNRTGETSIGHEEFEEGDMTSLTNYSLYEKH